MKIYVCLGTPMWNFSLKDTDGKQISPAEFYSYHFQVRLDESGNIAWNPFHASGILFQQFMCDVYSKMEIERLQYLFLYYFFYEIFHQALIL